MKRITFSMMFLGMILLLANITMAQMYRVKLQATGEYLNLDQQSGRLVKTKNSSNTSNSWYIFTSQSDNSYTIRVSANGKYLREDAQSGRIILTDNKGDDYSKFFLIKNPSGEGLFVKAKGSGKLLHADGQGVTVLAPTAVKNANFVIFAIEQVKLRSPDMVANCKPSENQIAIFTRVAFGGFCGINEIGEYPNLTQMYPGFKTGSLKAGRNVGVYFCTGANFTGDCKYVIGIDQDLRDNGFDNGKWIKSFKVVRVKNIPKSMRPKLIANTPVGHPTPPSPGFEYCADEGKTCRYTGKEKMMRVAFGSSGKFKYKYINIPKQGRSVSCNSVTFNFFNSTGRNRCYVMGLALDPSPTPVPTPTPIKVTPVMPQVTTSTTTSVVNEPESNVEDSTTNTISDNSNNNSVNGNSNESSVVMPANSSVLKLVYLPYSRGPISDVYLRPNREELQIKYGSPSSRRFNKREYFFDFLLNSKGDLFYIKSWNYRGFFNGQFRNEMNRVRYSTPSKLVKIAGTDTTYNKDEKRTYTNLYALTADGKIVRASFDANSQKLPVQISFRVFHGGFKFIDLYYEDRGKLLALTNDSRLFYTKSAYSGEWTELLRTNFVKFASGSGAIYGLSANKELYVTNYYGKYKKKILDNVKDFSVVSGNIYFISSETNLLMKASSDGKSIVKVDEKGTFVKFVSKSKCIVQNGNRQTFTCE